MRRVGISFLVGVLVVNAVCSDPENRPPLEREAAAHGDEIFDPLGGFVTAMREQAMVGHPDTDVDGEEVHDDKGGKVLPGKEEEGSDGAYMEQPHGDSRDPVDAALLVLATHPKILLDLLGDFGYGRNNHRKSWCFGWRRFDGGEGSHIVIYPRLGMLRTYELLF